MPEKETEQKTDATKTWAVVVGIERYGFNSDLDGPASDACRFVNWLRERQKVPASQIKLFLSPLPKNRGLADNLDVTPKHANQSLIYDLFEKELPMRIKGKGANPTEVVKLGCETRNSTHTTLSVGLRRLR
ncbi:MAG: hypothetical protein SF097_20470 [Acidobacteriota bacterium]|nr:hypothetical protein [Acidobacteriota bacterium]